MKAIAYEPLAGTHIRDASETARRMAVKRRRPVRFRFNDVVLVATRKTSVDSLLWSFDLVMHQHRQAYRNSRRGREAAARRSRVLQSAQQVVDHLLNTLDASIQNGLSDTVLWLSRFSDVADDCDLRYSKEEIRQKLLGAGYIENQHVGCNQEDFDVREILGQYIVGQAINCLGHGLPPHPITSKFAAKYATL